MTNTTTVPRIAAPQDHRHIVRNIAERAIEFEENYCGPMGDESPSYARGHTQDLSDIWVEHEEVEVDYTLAGELPTDASDEGVVTVCRGYGGPEGDEEEITISVVVSRTRTNGLLATYQVEPS